MAHTPSSGAPYGPTGSLEPFGAGEFKPLNAGSTDFKGDPAADTDAAKALGVFGGVKSARKNSSVTSQRVSIPKEGGPDSQRAT